MSYMVSKSEYALWKSHPMSEVLLKYLDLNVEHITDRWITGTFTKETVDGTAQLQAQFLGRAQMAKELRLALETGNLPQQLMLVIPDEEES